MALCFVSLALLLTAIAAGMFLLAKTNKDGLSNFFRFVSWFIIVSGFIGLLLCGLMCICRMCCHGGGGGCDRPDKMMMMHQGMRGGEGECMMQGGMNKEVCIKKMECEGEMNCHGMKKECCKEEGKCEKSGEGCKDEKGGDCCKDQMKTKKDTVIVKVK